MTARIFFSILVALGLSMASDQQTPSLQTNSNTISGHVSNDQNTPLVDIRAELLDKVDSVIRTVRLSQTVGRNFSSQSADVRHELRQSNEARGAREATWFRSDI